MEILIILSAFAAFSFALFCGTLDSKYFERINISIISRYGIPVPAISLVVAALVSAYAKYYADVTWLPLAEIFCHSVFHCGLAALIIIACVKFETIEFKFNRQYLLARGSLYFAVVFEVLAFATFVVCCVKYF